MKALLPLRLVYPWAYRQLLARLLAAGAQPRQVSASAQATKDDWVLLRVSTVVLNVTHTLQRAFPRDAVRSCDDAVAAFFDAIADEMRGVADAAHRDAEGVALNPVGARRS